MDLLKEFDAKDFTQAGNDLHGFASELFPICRSITGDGLRQTLELVKKRIPLQTFEVASGTAAFDWTLPKEWNIRDAYIRRREAGQDLPPGRIGDRPEHPIERLCLIFTHVGEYTPSRADAPEARHLQAGPPWWAPVPPRYTPD